MEGGLLMRKEMASKWWENNNTAFPKRRLRRKGKGYSQYFYNLYFAMSNIFKNKIFIPIIYYNCSGTVN